MPTLIRMRAATVLCFVLGPVGAGVADDSHKELPGRGWVVRFSADREADGRKVAGMLERIVDALKIEFAAHEPSRLLDLSACRVFVHGAATDKASEGTMTLTTQFDGMRCQAEIHLLAPSAHPAGAATAVGEPKDDAYFHKTLTHEYATILMELISRDKPQGWRFNSQPSWFVQGYEEYVGLFASSDHSRLVTYPKYLRVLKADPERVRPGDPAADGFGLEVRDPYIDGAVLLKFMHDVWGRARVQAILKSREAAFGGALRDALGVERDEFLGRWRQWLAAQTAD